MSQTKRELQPEHNLAPEPPDRIQPFDRDPDFDIEPEPLPYLTLTDNHDIVLTYPKGGPIRLMRGRDAREGRRLYRMARIAFNLGAGFGHSCASKHLDQVEHYLEERWPAEVVEGDIDDAF